MTEFSREYGEGLYELAFEEQRTALIYDQLQVLRKAFNDQPEYIKLLSNRALGLNERIGIIDEAFKGRIDEYLLNFLKLLCSRDAMHEFGRCVQVYNERYNTDNRVSVAVVTTAKPLEQPQKEALIKQLAQMTGNTVHLIEKTDASLMGGVVLEMNGKRWDNSIRQRLETIRQQISGGDR